MTSFHLLKRQPSDDLKSVSGSNWFTKKAVSASPNTQLAARGAKVGLQNGVARAKELTGSVADLATKNLDAIILQKIGAFPNSS